MKNITLALDEEMIKAGREYAHRHHTSLNELVRNLLQLTIGSEASPAWLEEAFQLADRAKGNSHGRRWTRQDLYDV